MDKWILKIKKGYTELEFLFDCWSDLSDFFYIAAVSANDDYEFVVKVAKGDKK